MNSFFRICVMICLLMLVFSLVANFVSSLDIFPGVDPMGVDVDDSDALSVLTGLDDANMNAIWLGVTGLTFIGAVALAALTRSMTPIGLHLFGMVFWTSWIRMNIIFVQQMHIPGDFFVIATVGMLFLFIAAIVGLMTGGG